MTDDFLTFQRFNDIDLAIAITEKIKHEGIECILEDGRNNFNPNFAYNTTEFNIIIKIKSEDFLRANKILGDYYKSDLGNVEQDYYLFEFTDAELMDIISKPDEWGHFDYQLAQKILNDRGKEIKPEAIEFLKAERIKDLAKPDSAHGYLIYWGYILAVLGARLGLTWLALALIIGWILAYYKKTLPDGQRVYAYTRRRRVHGTIITGLTILCTIVWIIIWR